MDLNAKEKLLKLNVGILKCLLHGQRIKLKANISAIETTRILL